MTTQPTGYSIKLLPQLSTIQAGVQFLVQSSTGTQLFDYANFIISQDNITFNPLLCSFSTSIDYLSAVIDANDLNNQLNFIALSTYVVTIIDPLTDQYTTLNQTVTGNSSNIDNLEQAVDQNTTNIQSISTNEINDVENLQYQIDILTNLITTLSAQAQSVFTTVAGNSAYTLQSNNNSSTTPSNHWSN